MLRSSMPLLEAAENGKQVAVLLELKARFDEESNIGWARKLEEYGVHVVYGLLGLKVHCKACAHRAAGGRCYSSLCPPLHRQLQLGNRAALHRHRHAHLRSLTSAPTAATCSTSSPDTPPNRSTASCWLRRVAAGTALKNSQCEIDHQKAGRPRPSDSEDESLVDRKMIQLLYQASQAGVKVDLLVRGICCLRLGCPE